MIPAKFPVDRVMLSAECTEVETSAEAFFRGLLAEGRVVLMARQISHSGELAGEPELRRAVDGLLFPINAAFDYEAEGRSYRVEMDGRYGRLYVRLAGPVAGLETMQRLLPAGRGPLLRVSRAGLRKKAAVAFFQLLRTRADQVRLVPGKDYEKTELTLDTACGERSESHPLRRRNRRVLSLARGQSP